MVRLKNTILWGLAVTATILFIFLINILIVIYSCLYYVVKKILNNKDFFLCIKTAAVKSISKIYGGQSPEI